jgi:hypothetical protein
MYLLMAHDLHSKTVDDGEPQVTPDVSVS